MNQGTKIALIGGGLVTAAAAGYYTYKRLNRAVSTVSAKLGNIYGVKHKGNGLFGNLQLKVDIDIGNPSDISLTAEINSIKVLIKGTEIGSTTVSDTKYTIPAKGSKKIEGITFTLPYQKMFSYAADILISALKGSATTYLKENLTLQVFLTVNDTEIDFTLAFNEEKSTDLSGTLELSAGKRDIKDGSKFNRLFPTAKGNHPLINRNGSVDETVRSMHRVVDKYHNQCSGIVKFLNVPGDIKATARKIFNFAYSYLQYENDTVGKEELRTPARSWHDGQILYYQKGMRSKGIDCDDFSMFVASCLRCLNIPFVFRITKYDNRSYYQHVYTLIPASNNNSEIIIDPVLDEFNYEKPYSAKKDFTMNSINGLPIELLGGVQLGETSIEEMKVAFGMDLEGIGSTEDKQYKYLLRTYKVIKNNPDLVNSYQSADSFLQMLQYAIDNWNQGEEKREAALKKLADIEDTLIEKGVIDNDVLLAGIDDIESDTDLDEDLEGLLGKRKKKSKKSKKSSKKKSSTSSKKKKGGFFKNIKKGLVRYNPATATMRGALLAALRTNMLKVSTNLVYGYLPTLEDAIKAGLNQYEYEKRQSAIKKLEKALSKMGGKKANIKKAILKGAKKEAKKIGVSGIGDLGLVDTVTEIIKDIASMIGKKAKSKKSSSSTKSSSTTSSSTTSSTTSASTTSEDDDDPDEDDSFFKKHKKTILIGAGVTGALLVGYGIYRVANKDDDKKSKTKNIGKKKEELKGISLT